MKNFIVMPDSFKGTMSSQEVCGLMRDAVMTHIPDARVKCLPVADGGEGTVDAFLAAVGGSKPRLLVTGPRFEKVPSFYGILLDGKTAVVEMAAAAGLPLMGDRLDVCGATTFGVGELIADAVSQGAEHIILGLGGSATNDGGCGAAAALGVVFRNRAGKEFVPTGGTLCDIASIDAGGLKLPENVRITAMCDISNPLYGGNGAAAIFGPQKGASPEMVSALDDGLRCLHEAVLRDIGRSCAFDRGAGAAGGMGYGAAVFFGAELKMGIDIVLNAVDFDSIVGDADCVFTGEGRLDAQSLGGKVVVGVARAAKKHGVPVIAVVGDVGGGIDSVYDEGVSAVFSINRTAVPYSEARLRAKGDLFRTVEDIIRLIKISE